MLVNENNMIANVTIEFQCCSLVNISIMRQKCNSTFTAKKCKTVSYLSQISCETTEK